jgi:hypothetical protein
MWGQSSWLGCCLGSRVCCLPAFKAIKHVIHQPASRASASLPISYTVLWYISTYTVLWYISTYTELWYISTYTVLW